MLKTWMPLTTNTQRSDSIFRAVKSFNANNRGSMLLKSASFDYTRNAGCRLRPSGGVPSELTQPGEGCHTVPPALNTERHFAKRNKIGEKSSQDVKRQTLTNRKEQEAFQRFFSEETLSR